MGFYFLLATNLLTIALLFYCVRKLSVFKQRYRQRGLFKKWPIPKITPEAIDSVFLPAPLGPKKETEIRFVANYNAIASLSDFEIWVICNLAKKSKNIFELGTASGKTTYLLAANSPPEAQIVTITLAPEEHASYSSGEQDDKRDIENALTESVFDHFYYEHTDVAGKVIQLFGDSKTFDESPYREYFDLVFVDGSHAESYVESDSAKAVKMVKPGGYVIWHDYRGPSTPGVFKALNRLSKQLPLKHISDTSFVVYQKPGRP